MRKRSRCAFIRIPPTPAWFSKVCVTLVSHFFGMMAPTQAPSLCALRIFTVSRYDDYGRGGDNFARQMAKELDCNNGQQVAEILRDVYRTDRNAFNSLVRDINRYEQSGKGDDLVIESGGRVVVNDREWRNGRPRDRDITVGQLGRGNGRDERCDDDFGRGGRGRGGRNDDCDEYGRPRNRDRDWDQGRGRDWDRGRGGRGGVDIDIDIDINRGRRRDNVDIGLEFPNPYPPDCFPDGRRRGPVFNPPIVDRECDPPVIRRREPRHEPDWRRSGHGGGGGYRGGEYSQDGEIAGSIIGGVIGGVIGHNNSGRRDNTLLGVLAGGAIGNVIGREVDRERNNNRAREYGWR